MTFAERAIAILATALLLSACQDLTPVPAPDTGTDDDASTDDGGGDETTDALDDSQTDALDDAGDASAE